MSGTAAGIVGLCGRLVPYAEAPALRPHYTAVHRLYVELEELMRGAEPPLVREVFADPRLPAMEAALHRLRAAYEFEKERGRALEILESRDPPARLAAFLVQEGYWALGAELRRALAGCRCVLVAGSGALPLTALAIAAELGARVAVLERDPEAFALGQRLIETAGRGAAIEGIEADILDLERLYRFDAIVGAVLLGVSTAGAPGESKTRTLRRLVARLRPGGRLILRDPQGLGRLLYPAADFPTNVGLAITRDDPDSGPGIPYRSGLIVARRLANEEGHAEPSALSLHP